MLLLNDFKSEARAARFYLLSGMHPPPTHPYRVEGPLVTWEDSEVQKREWDKEAYMNEMFEDSPNNGPWDL